MRDSLAQPHAPREGVNESVVEPTTVTTTPVGRGERETLSLVDGARRSRPAALWGGGEFGDYELIEEIARGGMGVVFKARQKSLNRVVALKMILAGQLADEDQVRRFRAEAEAAANLDHPGIVPVYEVGEEAGQHFFSMGFVDGESLAKRVADGPLPPREAAELMRRIAEAVAYAHGKGVIHRDLKPGNVLVDPSGQPRVTDFGLAKQIGGDSGLTATGQVMGTPSYMPPEQAQGKLDQIDSRADVYSLGAILYCLLTGRPPFQAASTLETLKQVVEQEPVPPRQLNPQVPRDLETIALKCLEKDPIRRYAAARDVADELGRYLRDESIAARPVGRAARLWRWCKRNKAVAALTASVAVVLVAGIAVSSTLAVVASRNSRLAMDRSDVIDAKNKELTTANEREREAATAARAQSQLALNSLQSVIFDIARKLDNVPGGGALRRDLLNTAIARLEEVSDQFASRGAIDRNTAVAHMDLGDVLLRIGSDAPDGTGDGPLAAARKQYERCHEIFQELAEADPSGSVAQRDLSASHQRLGIVQLRTGQVSEALASYQKSLEIFQNLATADPNDAAAQRALSDSHYKLGDARLRTGQVSEAMASYQKSLEIDQKLAAADPSDAVAQRNLSVSHEKLGDVQLETGQVTEALASYQKSLEIAQKLAAADPSDAAAQRDLYVAHIHLGDVQLQTGRVTEALASYQKSLEITQKLASADPNDAVVQRDLAVSHNNLGDVQLQTGQVREALASKQKSLEIFQKLAAADPSNAEAQGDLSLSHNKLGDVQLQTGQVREALASYQKSLEMSQKLAAADPSDTQAQLDLYSALATMGEAECAARQFERAIGRYEEALGVLDSLEQGQRLPPPYASEIGLLRARIQECKLAPAALGDWPTVLEQPADVLPALLAIRGRLLVQVGRIADAAQAAAKLRELGTATAGQLYDSACVLSLCAAAIKPAEGGELSAEQSAQRQQHIDSALDALRAAIAAGYSDFQHMSADPDLAALRELPEFKELTSVADSLRESEGRE